MDVKTIFENNRSWAAGILEKDPNFFKNLENIQTPKFMWIGCSDSRVPANEILGLKAGEVFVHRNVANLVVHTDLNCLSVLQYAVEVLKVEHVIVTGHYNCGGVNAALGNTSLGLIDNWLRNIKDVIFKYKDDLKKVNDLQERRDKLAEYNVKEQVLNLCHTTIVQEAWSRGQSLSVHGFIYALGDGMLRDLKVSVSSSQELSEIYQFE